MMHHLNVEQIIGSLIFKSRALMELVQVQHLISGLSVGRKTLRFSVTFHCVGCQKLSIIIYTAESKPDLLG